MENKVIANFFSDDELRQISEVIQHELATREHVDHFDLYEGMILDKDLVYIKRDLCRLDITNLKMPPNIIQKVTETAKKYYALEKSYVGDITNITYSEYSLKYAPENEIPNLFPHLDYGNSGLILDYQFKSNTNWAIAIEDKEYILNDNEVLFLYPLDQYHWRPKKNWLDNEYVGIIFFDFMTPGLERVPDIEKEKRLRDMMYNVYKENS